MSLDIQVTQTNMATITAEASLVQEENQIEEIRFEYSENPQGTLSSPQGKRYTCTQKFDSPPKLAKCFKQAHPTKTSLKPTELYRELSQSSKTTQSKMPEKMVEKGTVQKEIYTKGEAKLARPMGEARTTTPQATRTAKTDQVSQSRQMTESRSSLRSRNWSQKETLPYWEARYHEKEREGQGGQHQQQHRQEEEEKSGKKSSTSKINEGSVQIKPQLPRPKLGIFALYYILTKMGIASDGTSNSAYQQEIKLLDAQTTETHKERLKEMREALKKEQSAKRWGIATKIFSWLGSLMSVFAGIGMIVTGVGAVAGAMLLTAGVIQLTNQLLEITGGWRKIAEKLPGDDDEKKRAVINWIQIGIAVLCLVLSGIGIVMGGYSNVGEAMGTAMSAIGGITFGVTSLGKGIVEYLHKGRLAKVKRHDYRLAQLKHNREDLMDKVKWGVDRLEQLFEDLSKALDFEIELFRANQRLYY